MSVPVSEGETLNGIVVSGENRAWAIGISKIPKLDYVFAGRTGETWPYQPDIPSHAELK
ncbi:hypothetical protein P692DRAFT_20828561 [Suillus brevipes Sb2]|nr:hypothetical protein P692DRAFT_20828561 [Suillus brevipes Sb2]